MIKPELFLSVFTSRAAIYAGHRHKWTSSRFSVDCRNILLLHTNYSLCSCRLQYLLKDLRIPEANIILWGYSIGTVASVELALRASQVAGLILYAPLTSILRTLCWRRCCWRHIRTKRCDCCCDKFSIVKKVYMNCSHI